MAAHALNSYHGSSSLDLHHQCAWSNTLPQTPFVPASSPHNALLNLSGDLWRNLSPRGRAGLQVFQPVFEDAEGKQKALAFSCARLVEQTAQRLGAPSAFDATMRVALLPSNLFDEAHAQLGPKTGRSLVLRQADGVVLVDAEGLQAASKAQMEQFEKAMQGATTANVMMQSQAVSEALLAPKTAKNPLASLRKAQEKLAEHVFCLISPQAAKPFTKKSDIKRHENLKRWLPQEQLETLQGKRALPQSSLERKIFLQECTLPFTVAQSFALLQKNLRHILPPRFNLSNELGEICYESTETEQDFFKVFIDPIDNLKKTKINLKAWHCLLINPGLTLSESIFHETVHIAHSVEARYFIETALKDFNQPEKQIPSSEKALIKCLEELTEEAQIETQELLPDHLIDKFLKTNRYEKIPLIQTINKEVNSFTKTAIMQDLRQYARAFDIMKRAEQIAPGRIVEFLFKYDFQGDTLQEKYKNHMPLISEISKLLLQACMQTRERPS